MSAQDSMVKAKALYEKARRTNYAADYNNAITALKVAVNEGFGEAAYILGNLYFRGYSTTGGKVKADDAKALSMYEKSVELGQDDGLLDLGRIYLYGWGTDQNPEKAFSYFSAATQKRLTGAKFFLAFCHLIGIGTDKDEDKAFEIVKDNYSDMIKYYDSNIKWMTAKFLADDRYYDELCNKYCRKHLTYAAHGEFDQCNMKASCYTLYKTGLPSYILVAIRTMYANDWPYVQVCRNNDEKAIDYVEMANTALKMEGYTDKERAEIAYYYVRFREKAMKDWGVYDIKEEMPKVVSYLTFAAENGYVQAMIKLADWYERGHGVSKNLIKSKEWKEKATALEEEAEKERELTMDYHRVEVKVDEKAFANVEISSFLQENMQHPTDENGNIIKGNVLLRFVVGRDGKVSKVKVVNSQHPLLTQEAFRLLSLLPDFVPAKLNGETVPTRLQWNIEF